MVLEETPIDLFERILKLEESGKQLNNTFLANYFESKTTSKISSAHYSRLIALRHRPFLRLLCLYGKQPYFRGAFNPNSVCKNFAMNDPLVSLCFFMLFLFFRQWKTLLRKLKLPTKNLKI